MGYSLQEAERASRNGGFRFAGVRTWWVEGEGVLAYPEKKNGFRACQKGRVELKLKRCSKPLSGKETAGAEASTPEKRALVATRAAKEEAWSRPGQSGRIRRASG